MSHLIGFYRENGQIRSVYSEQKTFYDLTLQCEMEPVLVPLSRMVQNREWQLSDVASNLPEEWRSFIEEGSFFVTSETSDTAYWVLSYVAVSNPNMSYHGIVVKKVEGQFQPVEVEVNGEPFLMDLVGCGSPEGGYASIFFREDPMSLMASTLQITGGVFSKNTQHEFDALSLYREQYSHFPVIPIGVTEFDIGQGESDQTMGQYIRLVPSSFRLSFVRHPELDRIKPVSRTLFYSNAGRELGQLLGHHTPFFCQDLSERRLIMVNPNQYILFSFDEVRSVLTLPTHLGTQSCLLPRVFQRKNIDPKALTAFQKGVMGHDSLLSSYLTEMYTDAASLNHRLLHYVSRFIFEQLGQVTPPLEGVARMVRYCSLFVSPTYFSSELSSWAKTELADLLRRKHHLLTYYVSFSKSYGHDVLLSCWNQTCEEDALQLEFNQRLVSIDSGIRVVTNPFMDYISGQSVLSDQDQYLQFSPEDVGVYAPLVPLRCLFYAPPRKAVVLEDRLKSVLQVQSELKDYLSAGALRYPKSVVHFSRLMAKRQQHRFLLFYLYPFLGALWSYFNFQRTILMGVFSQLDQISKEEEAIVKESLAFIDEKEHLLREQPDRFYTLFKVGEKAIIEDIRVPYMGAKDSLKASSIPTIQPVLS